MKVLGLILVLFGLAACAPHQPAPVISAEVNPLYHSKGNPKTKSHRVKRGETLYSIAWHYGKDVKYLIAVNKLPKPYTIYPGQVIRLQAEPVVAGNHKKNKVNSKRLTSGVAKASKPVQNTSSKPTGQSSKKVVKSSLVPAGQKMYGDAHQQKLDKDHTVKPAAKNTAQAVKKAEKLTWQWPVTGSVIGRFSVGEQGNQGIDIAGSKGTVIHAAAGGEVVYAGAALRGFGRLLIISHQDDYLSAYAHNERLLVKEKDRVRAGQPIAQMGSTGAERVKLHFEIRHQGQPVDPIKLLPKLR